MSSVLGKFVLQSCETYRPHGESPQGGAGAHITLKAVQSESWGKYTPNGSLEMHINNPAAAKVFIDAWARFTSSPDGDIALPYFYLRLTPADEADRGQVEA